MTYTVRAQGRLQTAEEFGAIAVRSNPDGSVVRLKDVARIELGALNYQQIGRVNGQPGCADRRLSDARARTRSRSPTASSKTMADLQRALPARPRVSLLASTRRCRCPKASARSCITLGEAIVLVIFVVFLFLQNWRATLIPMIAVPVSLIGTFAVFPLLGFSINTLSLFGLVLAIGLVVDDAIVVVEAVEHHIEEGMTPRDATLKAMEEVSGPVVSIALILASVFIPVGFMGGIQGRLNKQFAITIAISVLISAFNALTLSPALSAMLLKPREAVDAGCSAASSAASTAGSTRRRDGYVARQPRPDPQGGRRRRAAGRLHRARAWLLGRRLPTSFVPEEDYGYFLLNVQLPRGGVARAHRRGLPQDRCSCSRRPKGSPTTTRSPASACSRA